MSSKLDQLLILQDCDRKLLRLTKEEQDIPIRKQQAEARLESLFLTSHKYYSRAQEVDPIAFGYVCADTGQQQRDAIDYPCYLKPAALWLTMFQHVIDDEEEMQQVLSDLRHKLPPWSKPFRDFFTAYICSRQYRP